MLPKQIDLIQLTDNEILLKGEVNLLEADRLLEFTCDNPEAAFIDLRFGRDVQGYRYIKGGITTKINVICQRCSQPMLLVLNIKVAIGLVRTDQEAIELPKQYDPLLLSAQKMPLNALIEEEILLSIPLVPKHAVADCKIKPFELYEFEEEENKPNPFAILKKLLRE